MYDNKYTYVYLTFNCASHLVRHSQTYKHTYTYSPEPLGKLCWLTLHVWLSLVQGQMEFIPLIRLLL